MARIAVADLVGGILPDLADKHSIGLFLKECAADIRDERLLQLVGHIEAPAACAGARPAADDPVFTKEEVANGERILVQRRHVADAPPARIGSVLVEMVCVFPARALALPGTRLGIVAIAVEIDGIIARVVEYTVEDD